MTVVTPLHAQLKEVLIADIVAGEYAEGDRIPSERDLCERYNVSRTTTRRTLSELVHEGWLYTVTGKGTYVANWRLNQELRPLTGFADDLVQRGIEVASQVVALESLKASQEIADRLGLRPLSPVIRLKRVRFAGETPIAVQTAFLPEHRCPGLQTFDFSTRSLYDVLRTEFGLKLQRGDSVITADLASDDERDYLRLPAPSAVLRTYQTTFLDDGTAIEFCESVFHGELYHLTFDATSKEGQLTSLAQPHR